MATLNCNKEAFHTGPLIDSSGSFEVTKTGTVNGHIKVRVKGSVTITIRSGWHYNTPPAFAEQVTNYAGLSVQIVTPDDSTDRKPCQSMTTWDPSVGRNGAYVTRSGKGWFNPRRDTDTNTSGPTGGYFTVSYDKELEWGSGNLKVYCYCVWKTDGTCDQNHSKEVLGSLSLNDLYQKPTISISSSTSITNYNSSRTISVAANTSGDNNATTVKVTVNGYDHNTSIGNSAKDFSFKPSDNGVSEASSYKVKARRTHNSDSSLYADSNELTLYTYKLPDITSFSVSPSTISGNTKGSPQIKWSCNNRKWTTMEKQFKTYYSTDNGSSWTDIGVDNPTNDNAGNTAQSLTITKTFIDNILTQAQRSNDSATFKLMLMRKNESSGKTQSTSNVTVTVNYKPTKTIGSSNITYYDCTSDNKTPDTTKPLTEGNEYYIDEHPYVYVQWTYPSNADGGVIDGYIFKVYTDSTYSTIKTTKTINTTDLTTGQALNIRTELNRGTVNYIGITPFYNKADGTGKLYGTENKKQFIKPIGKLHKPVIDGPITGKSWHNNQFRILVTAPADDDFDVEEVAENDYRYKAIELDINNTIYTFASNSNIFSTATVTYQKPLVINPSLIGSSFPDVNSYTMKIRFQKNYYSNVWSEWSDSVTISNTAINEITQAQGIKKRELVLINHYTTVRNYSIRLYDVYFINRNNLPGTNKELTQGSIIKAENYQGIYDSILQIQNRVNNYATFDNDRINVSFNRVIDNFDGNNKPIRGEIITQDKISNDPIGRNYMNICIECMNKLSN